MAYTIANCQHALLPRAIGAMHVRLQKLPKRVVPAFQHSLKQLLGQPATTWVGLHVLALVLHSLRLF